MSKKPRWTRRTLLVVGAPLVAVATLMLGLRVGAGDAVRAATLFAAPPGRAPSADAKTPVAWQLLTYVEDRSVRETVSIGGLTVVARSKGKEARWSGASNIDGIAEVTFALDGLAPGDPVDVEVRAAGEATPLAAGTVAWRDVAWGRSQDRDADELAAARPSKRQGPLGIDVVVEGERLVVGTTTPLWIRITPPKGTSAHGVTVDVEPEAGLRPEKDRLTVECASDTEGWALLPAIAEGHVVGVGLSASTPKDAPIPAKGEWFGALPVAAGAFLIEAPRVLPVAKAVTTTLVAPNPRNVVYAEIDDERGRVFAAALDVATAPGDATPRARFELPPLAEGLHWLVVSGEPRGAERLAGATVAKPILVGSALGVQTDKACSVGPWLARRAATGFPRWIALDGMEVRGATNRTKHRIGLIIGLVSLLTAGILEVLLLVAASREARASMLLAELEEPDQDRAKITARPPGGGLLIAILIAILGFALLAALVIAKG